MCLLAEGNPITAKIIEILLNHLGCTVVVVADESEAISVAMGDISEFTGIDTSPENSPELDCILMDKTRCKGWILWLRCPNLDSK